MLGVAVAETTTVWGVVASFNSTVSGCGLRNRDGQRLRGESGSENFGFVVAIRDIREVDGSIAGGGENADAGVVGWRDKA